MEELKIEKNIPIPPHKTGPKRLFKPSFFEKLEVGDRFVVPKKNYRTVGRVAEKIKIKITTRTVTEPPYDKGDFLRVWRVE